MLRIWLNHWFSTAYNIINLIKENERDFVIIGSNNNYNSVIKCVCDEWYEEPQTCGDEYAADCAEFCKKHKVDVFIPRKEMLAISKNIHLFDEVGTKVMVDDYDMISVLNNKSMAYELFKDQAVFNVPEYLIVDNAGDFINAYELLKKKYSDVCMKLVYDEGGRSFRLISDKPKSFDTLFENLTFFYDVVEALKKREVFEPIMVMPYLPDNEISVDCLNTKQGLIMLPREKDPTRIERMIYDEKILSMCRAFYERISLQYPCNIQFKYLNGVPYFLEVNTRMSGGIQMGCAAAGVNIPNIAVNKIIGIDKDWKLTREESFVSYIEKPLLVCQSGLK
ncbi:MAG: hypothetical protein E7505_00980 [Ruminococcus sp.]|nr:hypothetical protein [Ruminococcus sp.]